MACKVREEAFWGGSYIRCMWCLWALFHEWNDPELKQITHEKGRQGKCTGSGFVEPLSHMHGNPKSKHKVYVSAHMFVTFKPEIEQRSPCQLPRTMSVWYPIELMYGYSCTLYISYPTTGLVDDVCKAAGMKPEENEHPRVQIRTRVIYMKAHMNMSDWRKAVKKDVRSEPLRKTKQIFQ